MKTATLKIEASKEPLVQCRRHVGVWHRGACPVCQQEALVAALQGEVKALKEASRGT